MRMVEVLKGDQLQIEADLRGRREGGRRHGGGRRMEIYRARRAEGLPLVQDGTHEKECGFNSRLDLVGCSENKI
jgi:hypothetical protein